MPVTAIKNRLDPGTKYKLRKLQRRFLRLKEHLVWGGFRREALLLRLLGRHYGSQYRRDWELGEEEPHFFSHRIGFFEFAFGESALGPSTFYRGFFASEVLKPDDLLLDIGCGDGFFTKRFFSPRCSQIDAVDIERTAIQTAQAENSAPNITYRLLDAVNETFPAKEYDVIVWDGALGHFEQETTNGVLEKIRSSLTPEGIFVGSESLGVEGSDHLQFFHSLDDFHALFKPYFKHIELRSVSYQTGMGSSRFLRQEGYWRCANDPSRLANCRWKDYQTADESNGAAQSTSST